MKRMILMAAMVLVALAAQAQIGIGGKTIDLMSVDMGKAKVMRPDTVMPNGEWQKVEETQLSAKECFKYMRQALAKIVPNYQRNVQLEDTTDNKIIFAASLPLMARANNGYWYHGFYNLTLTIVMKDNRFRVAGENVKCETGLDVSVPGVDTSQGLEFKIVGEDTNGELQRDLQWKAGMLMALIDDTLKKLKSEDDF